MALIDLIDLTLDVVSRRGTRIVGAVLVLGLLVVPGPTRDAISWYAQEKAERIVEILIVDLQIDSHMEPGPATAR